MTGRWVNRLMRSFALLAIGIMVWGCATTQLVSDYDEQIDSGLTQLYVDTSGFVDRMIVTAGTPAGAYGANKDFYAAGNARIEALILRAQAHKALDSCPSTEIVARALDAAKPPLGVSVYLSQIPRDDCQVVLFTVLKRSFEDLRTFHEAQGPLGIPASARGPILDGGVGAVIRAGLVVEIAKKKAQTSTTERGPSWLH